PFPGAEVLAGQPGLAAPALLASLGLPALAKARQQAADVGSVSNLRQIALGCQMYANDHAGKLPPDLGTLLADGYIQSSTVFVTPAGGMMAFPEGLPKEQARQWVNKNTTYTYVCADKALKEINHPSRTILVYERSAPSNRRVVAFVDGHCEMMPEQQFQQK